MKVLLTFLKSNGKNARKVEYRQTTLIAEVEVLELVGLSESEQLPLQNTVTMSARLRLSKIPHVGLRVSKLRISLGHQDAFGASPFRHRQLPHRNRYPVALAAHNDCFELRNEGDELLGYLSMDTMEVPPVAELWCAHIATLCDDGYRGLRLRVQVPAPSWTRAPGVWVDAPGVHNPGVQIESRYIAESHILAYCLVLASTIDQENKYRRVVIAEVQYEWIFHASTVTVSLV